MIKLGVTGGIGSGKSLAADILKECGAYVIDCDIVARDVSALGTRGAELIKETFGSSVFFENGELDRKKLRLLVFNNPYKLALLNSILHPLIIKELKQRLSYAVGVRVVAVIAPLLFEMDLKGMFDIVWTISCPVEKRIERICQRDNIDNGLALNIINTQYTDEQRAKNAHLQIPNDSDVESFRTKISSSYNEMLSTHH